MSVPALGVRRRLLRLVYRVLSRRLKIPTKVVAAIELRLKRISLRRRDGSGIYSVFGSSKALVGEDLARGRLYFYRIAVSSSNLYDSRLAKRDGVSVKADGRDAE